MDTKGYCFDYQMVTRDLIESVRSRRVTDRWVLFDINEGPLIIPPLEIGVAK